MSANNFYYAHKIGDKYYGWDETAEEIMGDADHVRTLKLSEAIAEADTVEELEQKMDEKSCLGYSEYGITTQPFLPKNGLKIKVVNDLEEEKIEVDMGAVDMGAVTAFIKKRTAEEISEEMAGFDSSIDEQISKLNKRIAEAASKQLERMDEAMADWEKSVDKELRKEENNE